MRKWRFRDVKLFHELPGGSAVKNPPAMQMRAPSLGQGDPPEEGMATHSSITAWRIPMDRGAWRATIHGFAKNLIQLKQLSTHAYSYTWFADEKTEV